jgi:hypothetical protein
MDALHARDHRVTRSIQVSGVVARVPGVAALGVKLAAFGCDAGSTWRHLAPGGIPGMATDGSWRSRRLMRAGASTGRGALVVNAWYRGRVLSRPGWALPVWVTGCTRSCLLGAVPFGCRCG